MVIAATAISAFLSISSLKIPIVQFDLYFFYQINFCPISPPHMKQFLPDDAIPLLCLVVEHPVQIVGDQVERVVEASNLDVATEKEGNVIDS